jgi:hypothetical protein
MRSIYNAATDTIEELRLRRHMDEFIVPDPESQTRWLVRFISKPGAMVFFVIEVEVMLEENEEEPTLCVLHKVGISQRTLERVMDTFEERLSTPRLILPLPASSPPGGAPDQP